MMKIFVFCFACVLAHLPSFSQLSIGVKSGVQATGASTNTNDQPKSRPSYLAGIYGSYRLAKRISTTVELLYADKGHKIISSRPGMPNAYFHRTYLNVPVLAQYHCGTKLSFHGGGEFGFLLSSYAKVQDKKVNMNNYYGHSIDFGLTAGVNYSIDSRFDISLRYVYGLSNVVSKEAYFYINDGVFDVRIKAADDKYHNRAVQLSLNYHIHNVKPSISKIDSAKRHVSLGVKGGFNINNTLHENYFPYKYENDIVGFGGHLGMYLSISLSEKMSLVPEIQFIRKGYTHTQPTSNDKEKKNTISLYYVELPFIISYAMSEWVSFDIGPVFGQRVLVTEETPDGWVPPRKNFYDKNKSEFGLTAGFCFNVSKNFAVACRYYRGFTNISNLYNNNYTTEFNQGLQFSTYYRLAKLQ